MALEEAEAKGFVQRVNETELETNDYVREVMKELEVRFVVDLLEFGSVVDQSSILTVMGMAIWPIT